MKLLFDENLSPKLVSLLADLFPDSLHVRDAGLKTADDHLVWQYAQNHALVLVSKDSDMHQRSLVLGDPPKVVWVGWEIVQPVASKNCSAGTSTTLGRSTKTISLHF
jgi:predicted nuclease of predicted toxin-antitoxin system